MSIDKNKLIGVNATKLKKIIKIMICLNINSKDIDIYDNYVVNNSSIYIIKNRVINNIISKKDFTNEPLNNNIYKKCIKILKEV